MSALLGWSFDLLILVAAGAALFVVATLLRQLLRLLPLSRSRREGVERGVPVLAAALAFAYLAFATRFLLRGQPALVSAGSLLVLVVFVALSWGTLQDMAAGIFLRASRAIRRGDQLRIQPLGATPEEALAGRVARLGFRSVTLEASQGEEAVLPYTALLRSSIFRLQKAPGLTSHSFQVELPPGVPFAEARQRILRAALLSHWSGVRRAPEVTLHASQQLEVIVYPIEADRGPDLEAAVRRDIRPKG